MPRSSSRFDNPMRRWNDLSTEQKSLFIKMLAPAMTAFLALAALCPRVLGEGTLLGWGALGLAWTWYGGVYVPKVVQRLNKGPKGRPDEED